MARIKPLDHDAVSQLQSSKHITSLQGVVLALLENSLDAGSTSIDISLDFRRGGCEVEDTGCGVPSDEFSPHGNLGKMYHTSKHNQTRADREFHGVSGTFLASLAALCLLSITSKFGSEGSAASITFHQSRLISRHRPAPPAQDLTTGTPHGTRVTVRDLFGNIPVRLKQRALSVDVGSVDDKAWHELKCGIVALLLAWNRPCSVSIKDEASPRRALRLSTSHASGSNMLTERRLRHLGESSVDFDVRNALPVLVHSGLASINDRVSWVPISATTSKVSVTGVINLCPAPTKQCQFISIGIHPVGREGPLGDLLETVNGAFATSSFGCVEDSTDLDLEDAEKDHRKRDHRYKAHGFARKQLHGRRGLDRWPMFVLKVALKNPSRLRSTIDDMNATSLKAITDVLEISVTHWLETHHFRPSKRKRREDGQQKAPAPPSHAAELLVKQSSIANVGQRNPVTPNLERSCTPTAASTSKKRKYVDMTGASHYLETRPATMPAQPNSFASWSRIKSGREIFYTQIREGIHKHHLRGPVESMASKPSSTPTIVGFQLPSLEAGALNRTGNETPTPLEHDPARTRNHSSSDHFGSIDDEAIANLGDSDEQPQMIRAEIEVVDDQRVQWTDPVTKVKFLVNARTGVALPAERRSNTNHPKDLLNLNCSSRRPAAINTSLTSTGQHVTLARRTRSAVNADKPKWLRGFLKEWNNPIFTPQNEAKIPFASVHGPGVEATEASGRLCSHGEQLKRFAECRNAGTSNITKAGLKNAEVLSQVDRKFILCKVRTDGSSGERLVLVDQHAASERVILERLLAEICRRSPEPHMGDAAIKTPSRAMLERPLRFVVSSGEHELLRSRVEYFADWNILYDLTVRQEPPSKMQVRPLKQEHLLMVKGLPPLIAERSIQSPNLVIDLIRSEIHRNQFASRSTEHSNHEQDKHPWLSRIGSCPRGLLDMLNSRACRSAIMFNDALSPAQCEQLLQQLSDCAFPFMCAHGRVSMVPLVELGQGSVGTISSAGVNGNQAHGHDTARVYREWLANSQRDA